MVHSPDMTPLAAEFFVKFSRVEFALKHFQNYRNGDANGVEPNWDKFAASKHIADLFAPLSQKNDVAYIIAEPPKKRVVNGNSLDWKAMPAPKDMVELVVAIRRVRNNLFHGEKTNLGLSRNRELFNAAIAIMDAMLAADDDVRGVYESNLVIS